MASRRLSRLTAFCVLSAGFTAAMAQEMAQSADVGLEEVVVTAQRRVETLQKVPISISALSAEQVQQFGLTRAADLAALVPGLSAAGTIGDSNPVFAIRGIGLNDQFANNNPTVGVYFDDIVQPYAPLMGFPLFDIERVEVLKGPQGTLYGRNTTGGAINFISKAPSQALEGYLSASYGRFDRADIEGAIGGGLSDTFAVRLAGKLIRQSDGWQTNVFTGQTIGDKNVKAARAMALWTPTDALQIQLKASVLSDRSDSQLPEHVGNYAQPFAAAPCQAFLAGFRDEGNCVDFFGYSDPTPGRRTVESNEVYGHESDTDSHDFALNAKWDLGAISLTSVSGYIDYDRTLANDDGTPRILLETQFNDSIEAFSQELRLASNEDDHPLSWMVGVYYSWDQLGSKVLQALDQSVLTRGQVRSLQTTTSYALFSQLQYRLTDRLRLVGGARYTKEKKDFVYDAFDANPFGTSLLPPPVAGIDNTLREDPVTGKIGVDFDLTEDLMLYASASKGFKSGGYKGAVAFNPRELDPFVGENLYAYELGAKSSWLDGRLQFNTALYYYDYQGFQAFVSEIRGGLNIVVLDNAGDAEVYGLEAELNVRPTKRLLLRLSANAMHSEITSVNPSIQVDYQGNRLANAPELAASAVVRYDLPTQNLGFAAYALLDGSYRSRTYYSLNNRGQSSMDSYALLNARVGFTSPDERWELALWGRNLTDKLYVTSAYDTYGGAFPSLDSLGDPRAYGLSVTYRY